MKPTPGKARQRDSRPSLLGLVAMIGVVLILANVLAGQSQQAPTLRIVSEDGNRLPSVIITGANIRSLPAGETAIIQKFEGGDTGSAQTQAGGGVWKTSNGGRTWDLVKTGTGTLALPPASNTAKEGKGILVLTSSNDVVYEFHDLGVAEFDRVRLVVDGEMLTLNGPGYMARHRPADAMKGWPFKRLLIVPVKGVKEFAGTAKGDKVKDTPRQTRANCGDRLCTCSGFADCFSLIDSGKCSSQLNCNASGDVNCWCQAR